MPVTAKPASYTPGAATLRPNHLWMFDEGSGTTLTDIGSTGGKDLTIVGADWTTDGTHGPILDFIKANTDYAHRTETGSEPVMGITTGFTIALILRVLDTPASIETLAAVSDVSALNVYYAMAVDATGDITLAVRNTTVFNNDNVTAADLDDDVWHLAVVTIGDSVQSSTVDGAGYESASMAANINDAAIDTFTIGGRRTTSSDYGDVKVAAAAVWVNTLLSEAQQTSLWNGGDVWTAMGLTTAVKYLKLLVHADAQSDTSIAGAVFNAPTGGDITGAKIGEFTGAAFEATFEGGKAVLKVPVADFDGGALTTSDVPVVLVRNGTDTTGLTVDDVSIIEE